MLTDSHGSAHVAFPGGLVLLVVVVVVIVVIIITRKDKGN
jgi:hypothetical protein